MKRLVSVLLLLSLIVGCVGSSSVIGKYYDEENDSSYIELKKDGSVWIPMGVDGDLSDSIQLGTYEMEGSNITIIIIEYDDTEKTFTGTIKGKIMTLDIGEAGTFKYIRK